MGKRIKIYLTCMCLLMVISNSWAQEQSMIQVKALDQQLHPYPFIKISFNNGIFHQLDDQGTAYVEMELTELPPKVIEIAEEELEVESWNFSKGILEVMVRPRTHKKITVVLRDAQNQPVSGIKVAFRGSQQIEAISNLNGVIGMSIPLHEDLNTTDRFVVEDYQLVEKKFTDNHGYFKIIPIPRATRSKPLASTSGIDNTILDTETISGFEQFNFDYLDSVQSLTVFYAIIKNVKVENFDQEMTRKIDAKFYQLIGRWEDSLNRIRSRNFYGKISDSSLVQNDVLLLIDQAKQEEEALTRIKSEFDISVERLTEKLKGGGVDLSDQERLQVLDGIASLDAILNENEEKFYQNQAHYRDVLRSMRNRLSRIGELEEMLSFSELQRENDIKDFSQKLKVAVAISTVLALLGIISFFLTKKFKDQKNQLAKANEEVKRTNENLEEMVAERTVQLQKTNEELDTFLYKSSHDLRRPLTTIVGLSNIAHLTLNKESCELFERAASTARQMDRMLKKLINVSEINHPSNHTSINFDKILQNVVHQFDELITDQKIDVNLKVQSSINFHSYPDLIEIIFRNLLENALWFSTLNRSHDMPKVNVEVQRQNGHVTINLSDNGPGIDRKVQDNVWNMFFVGHEKSTGNGLGLYLALKAVEALEGEIQFQSKEGEYTSFEVKLPLNGDSLES